MAGAPEAFAQELDRQGGRLLQVSTDFVFNGTQGTPYQPEQTREPSRRLWRQQSCWRSGDPKRFRDRRTGTHPAYKLGDRARRQELRPHHASPPPRTGSISVVADQVGCPTSTLNLAQACWRTLQIAGERNMPAVMHWSDNGAASWYDVAVAVGRSGLN
jgi:dTDP-4-dehydrorhamnose reductase